MIGKIWAASLFVIGVGLFGWAWGTDNWPAFGMYMTYVIAWSVGYGMARDDAGE